MKYLFLNFYFSPRRTHIFLKYLMIVNFIFLCKMYVIRRAVLIQIATLSGHRPLGILTHPPPPYWRAVARLKKMLNKMFLFYLINICPSFKKLCNNPIKLKCLWMELNKIYHLFLTGCFFLSTEFTNVLFKRGFNFCTKCMKPFFANVILSAIDHTSFLIN